MLYGESSDASYLGGLTAHGGANVFINYTEEEIVLKNPEVSSVNDWTNAYKGMDGNANTFFSTTQGVGQYFKADFVKESFRVSRVRILNMNTEG